MSRVLLIPITLLVLLAALLPLLTALFAGGRGVAASLADPHLAPALHHGLAAAAAVAVIGVPVGFTLALALWQANSAARLTALGCCVLVLLMPVPILPSLHALAPLRSDTMLAFLASVARAAALAALILAVGLGRIPVRLVLAARAAGARPVQAWLHAVFLPLAWPLLAALAASFVTALAHGSVRDVLAPHLDLADAWVAPASLLLAAASIAALTVLLRPRGR
ncbi:MAG TPA: hypothetical protein VMB71_01805 [Acetobacteraceae bacterium]|nr:hypothetical protein [Acetobacteraceae bacterium]